MLSIYCCQYNLRLHWALYGPAPLVSVFLGFLCFLLNRLISRTQSPMRVGVWSASVHNGSALCITDRTSLLNIQLGFQMQYADGSEIKAGDVVKIDSRYRGTVIASMDLGEYLSGHEQWAYLKEGIMVDTDFAGLVHYTSDATDELVLLKRSDSPNSSLHTDPQAGQ